eukprot:15446813-Alexandrium_andersonii.AAC.1
MTDSNVQAAPRDHHARPHRVPAHGEEDRNTSLDPSGGPGPTGGRDHLGQGELARPYPRVGGRPVGLLDPYHGPLVEEPHQPGTLGLGTVVPRVDHPPGIPRGDPLEADVPRPPPHTRRIPHKEPIRQLAPGHGQRRLTLPAHLPQYA